jgi:hypothetical protein
MFVIVVAALVLFSLASIAHQFRACKRWLRRLDPASLLPTYTFFAPNPMTHDLRLVYRIDPGAVGPWQEVSICRGRRWFQPLMNPEKYYGKAFVDVCNFLLEENAMVANKKFIQASIHYISLLSLVDTTLRRVGASARTVCFGIVSSEDIEALRLKGMFFVSMSHRIEA